jgi:hypothetical protein
MNSCRRVLDWSRLSLPRLSIMMMMSFNCSYRNKSEMMLPFICSYRNKNEGTASPHSKPG